MSDYYNDLDDLPLFATPATTIHPSTEPTFFGTAEENKRHILRALKGQIVSCRDIDRLTSSRGQALIGELRKEGHQIQAVCRDGQNCYEYIGHKGKKIKVPKSAQEAYYQTHHWKQKAAERKGLDGYRCQQCGSSTELETHHWVYNLFQENVGRELITFCRDCHQSVHEFIKGGSCHFPNVVEEGIAERLGWNTTTRKWDRERTQQACA